MYGHNQRRAGKWGWGVISLTDYHAKFFAFDLTKKSAADSIEKLAGALADAQVDLNPHQVEAALFAFQNPFSNGAILADEVGLGKTIEAGLLLSQKWAERKRRLLVIAPANLRKQWSVELSEKFHLPSVILEAKSFNAAVKSGNLNPFEQPGIVLCSYQFVRSKDPYVSRTEWDLVVIDEAHRLRNVYKTSSKIAQTIRGAIASRPKVLLTATPLQNSLMELYGLVSIIDGYAFGDAKSFSARYVRRNNADSLAELKTRLAPICKRTLRRQVLEYIKYTNRHALVQEFIPSNDEQKLYDLVSDYLQKPALHALPRSQRQLMTLTKAPYEYVVYDSEVERAFAQGLESRKDIRLFMKLPDWFKVDTPLGGYNPDWAILKQDNETVYLVRETKGTKDFLKLRTSEADKIRCGKAHFDVLGVAFAVAVTASEV